MLLLSFFIASMKLKRRNEKQSKDEGSDNTEMHPILSKGERQKIK